MGVREDLLKKIERKRAEIAELEAKVALAREYLQALEDTFKMFARENAGAGQDAATTLRPGTALAKARDAIKKAGQPMHITDLLTAIGKGHSRNERAGLSGTLAAYVRRGEIFTRPAPNTFGLVEMLTKDAADVPPANFGRL
jgi:hypothetical protein